MPWSMVALLPWQFRNPHCEILALEILSFWNWAIVYSMSPYSNWCFYSCCLFSLLVYLLKIPLPFWIEKEKSVKEYERLSLQEGFINFRSLQWLDLNGSSVLSGLILNIVSGRADLPRLLLRHLQQDDRACAALLLHKELGFSAWRTGLPFIQLFKAMCNFKKTTQR